MPIIKTAEDLGNVIRKQRRELGWNQSKLADEVGVSRQWVIDIEKGKKTGAELGLALRALNVLGLKLAASVRNEVVSQSLYERRRLYLDRPVVVKAPDKSNPKKPLAKEDFKAIDIDSVIRAAQRPKKQTQR